MRDESLIIPSGRRISSTLIDSGNNVLWHYCPGCKEMHAIHYNAPGVVGNNWDWNQSSQSPTVAPSLKHHRSIICHYFLKEGMLQYLSDSEHELAGKTIELPDIPG